MTGAHPGTGSAPGSHAVLGRLHAVLFRCARCGSLVAYLAALRRAAEAERDEVHAGDGCAGPECSRAFSRSRYEERQTVRRAAITSGAAVLVEVPEHASRRVLYRVSQ